MSGQGQKTPKTNHDSKIKTQKPSTIYSEVVSKGSGDEGSKKAEK